MLGAVVSTDVVLSVVVVLLLLLLRVVAFVVVVVVVVVAVVVVIVVVVAVVVVVVIVVVVAVVVVVVVVVAVVVVVVDVVVVTSSGRHTRFADNNTFDFDLHFSSPLGNLSRKYTGSSSHDIRLGLSGTRSQMGILVTVVVSQMSFAFLISFNSGWQ